MSKFSKIVILGAPGSGKGTLAGRIVNKFKIKHISSGQMLRTHSLNHTSFGEYAKNYMDKGEYVPDDLMVTIMLSEIRSLRNTSWVLDGFPRTIHQAQQLWSKVPLDIALHIDVPYDVLINRVLTRWVHPASGRTYNLGYNSPKILYKDDLTGEDLIRRAEDRPEVIKDRLVMYQETAGPIMMFYERNGILRTFKGDTSTEIWSQIDPFLQSSLSV